MLIAMRCERSGDTCVPDPEPRIQWYEARFLRMVAFSKLQAMSVLLEIGIAWKPQRLTPAALHIGIDPHKPYLERLAKEGEAGRSQQQLRFHGILLNRKRPTCSLP